MSVRRVIAVVGLAGCVAVVVETLLLWDTTGRVMLTRLPAPADEATAAERDDLELLLAGTGQAGR